tara:strand:- start:565 stop:762 length:198 start_codon:yes stop_codon:yes gene_type:complete
MAKIKKGVNIFSSPVVLKEWAIDLSEACGSVLINKKPNVSKIDTLVEKFVIDYNENMEKINATKK